MNLVIVESPTKAKTISSFLGKDFVVKSSYGHVRDLPKSKMGIEIENNFRPIYVVPEKSKKIINELAKYAKKSERLILATDEDREGEAIAWHIIQALGGENNLNKKVERIVFHEITKKAIQEALKNPRDIDMNLVNAQQARRILDRLVGYELSPFLWKKIKAGLSAGRVQSAALRMLVEREKEIEGFIPQEYWDIEVNLEKDSKKFSSYIFSIDGKEIEKPGITSSEEVKEIIEDIKSANFSVSKVIKKEIKRKPLPPFTTSTLQQSSWQKLRFSAKQTMLLAQQLYENGYITYMRTDSTNLSDESIEACSKFLIQNFGKSYSVSNPRKFVTKSKLAQEAHEAIRPTDPFNTPEKIKDKIGKRHLKLYDLIWRRFIATQMPEAIISTTAVEINAKTSSKNYLLRASGQMIVFDGFLRVWQSKIEERHLPSLLEGDTVLFVEAIPHQHFTQPPSRFNDASLVKALEAYGIGRPSTYAPIISILETRGYVERDENRSLKPTGIGIIVTELLEKHFPDIVDYGFTASIEDKLDDIAQGKLNWVEVVRDFYYPFHQNLLFKESQVSRKEATERPSDEICEKCSRPMVKKYGKYGEFLACSGYPECKNIKKINPESLNIECPKCLAGKIVIRRTKSKKRIFYGCSRWPECDFVSWKKPSAKDESPQDDSY